MLPVPPKSLHQLLCTLTLWSVAAVAHAGVIAEYTFSGNADDTSGNAIHGTVFGATLTADRFGNASSAYSFDGIDDYILLEPVGSTGLSPASLTISAWAKTDSTKTLQSIIRNRLYGWGIIVEGDFVFPGTPGQASFLAYNAAGAAEYNFESTGQTVTDGAWHHFALTFDETTGTASSYIDGTLLNTTVIGPGALYYVNGAVSVGRDADVADDQFEGAIDDILIYDMALNAAEIGELAEVPAPQSLLLLIPAVAWLRIRRRARNGIAT